MTEKINYTVPVYKGKSLKEFSRLSDVWIKFVLASPEHQRYLIDLLNAIFEEEMPPCMEKEEKVTAIRFLDREQVREHLNERGAVLDILVETSQGQLINIEVYQYLRPGIKDKSLFNFARLFTSSSKQGREFSSVQTERNAKNVPDTDTFSSEERLKPVIIITLLSQELFRELPEEFVHPFALLHRNHPEVLCSDKLYLYFIEVPKCPEVFTQRRILRWLQYFKNRNVPGPGALQYTEADQIFADLERMEMDFVADYDNLKRYFDSEEQARVDELLMNEALRKEKESGIAIGEARGEARGETRGIFNTAKNMFKLGLTMAQIKESTGLSDALLEKARKGESLTDEDLALKAMR
ncbi:MAG TPA: Rpn family recombination-promoting nuclease/putative transposase [Candidatus Avisuccinivibrio pullicola]|nr:Rpn family recombination-promoting nuclease/putative transposase [Candidatus Avisuccinivibrio pullicola]